MKSRRNNEIKTECVVQKQRYDLKILCDHSWRSHENIHCISFNMYKCFFQRYKQNDHSSKILYVNQVNGRVLDSTLNKRCSFLAGRQ